MAEQRRVELGYACQDFGTHSAERTEDNALSIPADEPAIESGPPADATDERHGR